MSRPIIVCDRISKYYNLGANQQKGPWRGATHTLRDAVSDALRSGLKILRGSGPENGSAESAFWALKDISFEVGRGEVVGIVGRNGAGKSTLLKILSRIVEPTSGIARLRGRLASLLEVGTGFHPELSGRENIYLNGAILGMKKAEIDRKFDEIVAFAEIEKFLDTPVKRYSSGMYVRLAFAVAAHLEPEILIVDEVLAVGDFAFQKKCLGKMQEVASGDGRTILFVSHNMGALAQLCNAAVLLENGSISAIGSIHDVIKLYLKSGLEDDKEGLCRFPIDPARPFQWISAEVLHDDGTPAAEFSCDEPIKIRVRLADPRADPGHDPRPHRLHARRHPRPVHRLPGRRPVDGRAAWRRPAHLRDPDPRPRAGVHDLHDRDGRIPTGRLRGESTLLRLPAAMWPVHPPRPGEHQAKSTRCIGTAPPLEPSTPGHPGLTVSLSGTPRTDRDVVQAVRPARPHPRSLSADGFFPAPSSTG